MTTTNVARRCIALAVVLLAAIGCASSQAPAPAASQEQNAPSARRPNLLFITADDMGYDSLGCTGCTLADISPNLDRLAREGLLIDHCHVPTPICGPTRMAWITGTWTQRNGLMGHYNQPPKWFGPTPITTTLPELLRSQGGYYTGVVCKNPTNIGWHCESNHLETGLGRDPTKFEQITRKFIEEAKREGKPFFLHANSMDPHEFWAGQQHETKAWIDAMMGNKPYKTYANGKPYPEPQVTYTKDQIPVPHCWPDNDAVRQDLYTYYNSVRRLDETVGAILRALEASGEAGNTLVVFVSDNGIGREFGKWSLYPLGTRTPMIVRWPGVVRPGRRDDQSVVSAIDLAPTFLEVAGVAVPEFMDARSIAKIIRDERPREPREMTFVCFDYMNNYPEQDAKYPAYTRNLADRFDNYRPMRAMHGARYTYIWNGWANGTNKMPSETRSGDFMKILRATGHADRADFEAYRAREEFYDTGKDPGCLVNLIHEPALVSTIHEYRQALLAVMRRTKDQELPNFQETLTRTPPASR